MREADEKESSRVVAYTALETFCLELKFELSDQRQTVRSSKELMDRVQKCLNWLKVNKEASEASYWEKLKQLEGVSGRFVGDRNNNQLWY